MRVVRALLEEVEESQFSVLRRRTVTVTEEHHDSAAEAPQPDPPRRSVLLNRVQRNLGDRNAELPSDSEPASLETARRELPAAEQPT